jgi:hypothetical protein
MFLKIATAAELTVRMDLCQTIERRLEEEINCPDV